MDLAKHCLDVGLYTEHLDPHRRFWEVEVGLAYEEYLKLGGGVRQHRFGVNGSVLKVNHSRELLDDTPTGIRGLTIATDRAPAVVSLTDPDGSAVRLVPRGEAGVPGLEVAVAASDVGATRRWWTEGIGADDLGDGRVQVGTTIVALSSEPDRAPTGPMKGRGLRYLTIQVRDVIGEYERMVSLGHDGPITPTQLGETARIAFVRTPDGDWLELSQRANLTGPLS